MPVKIENMRTIKKVEVKPKFCSYIPHEMEQGIIYISEEFEVANHICLCGCGVQCPTPMDEETGWSIIRNGDKITITPSILNPICPNKSHYIITNNIANFV